MKQRKEAYDKIPIPPELSERVEAAIASVDRRDAEKKAGVMAHSRKLHHFVRTTGTLAAAFVLCLTVGANSSRVFAEELGSLPVLGPLVRVLTIRSYEEHENNVDLVAAIPQIEGAADVNAEIDAIVEAFIAKAKQDMADYKEAFFATGGTQEEWADRTMDIQVDYEVKYQEGPYLSLVLSAGECWIAAYQENHYYNLDLEHDRDITLEDLLGPDYIEICNRSIREQIEAQIEADENNMYFGYGPGADESSEELMFKTITPETSFYINEKGNPVICFAKYEIAPGYMGVREFEILQKY